jgi:hypothetical protein
MWIGCRVSPEGRSQDDKHIRILCKNIKYPCSQSPLWVVVDVKFLTDSKTRLAL